VTETRVIVFICAVLLAVGVGLAVRWRRCDFEAPSADGPFDVTETVRRYVWYVAIALTAGVIAGVTIIGAGGRLVMRILAVTGGSDAQGRITEADETVGRITTSGTIGFIVFVGVLGGIVFALVYLVVRRYLPAGVTGGALFGGLLLLAIGTRTDPLDPDNPDFHIVGPGWLAVLLFVVQGVLFGVTLAAVAGRLSTWLPPLAANRRVLLRYLGAALLAAIGFSVTFVLVAGCVIVVLVTRVRPIVDAVRSPRWLLAGRAVVATTAVVTAPSAIAGVVDIVTA
jgi:hypothetical protein